jgi:hypothetical protein
MSNSTEQNPTNPVEDLWFFNLEAWRQETLETADMLLQLLGGERYLAETGYHQEYSWTRDDFKRCSLNRVPEGRSASYFLTVHTRSEEEEPNITFFFSSASGSQLIKAQQFQATETTYCMQPEFQYALCQQFDGWLKSAAEDCAYSVDNWPDRKVKRVYGEMIVNLLSTEDLVVNEVKTRRDAGHREISYPTVKFMLQEKYMLDTQESALLHSGFDLAERREGI